MARVSVPLEQRLVESPYTSHQVRCDCRAEITGMLISNRLFASYLSKRKYCLVLCDSPGMG